MVEDQCSGSVCFFSDARESKKSDISPSHEWLCLRQSLTRNRYLLKTKRISFFTRKSKEVITYFSSIVSSIQPFYFRQNLARKKFKKWGRWHLCVNKRDGMRPKSPNSIHRAGPWCHIPLVLAFIGASYHLPNLIGFGGHSPPPATKTSSSRRLPSPLLSLLVVYYCAGFKGRRHLPHSSLSVTHLLPPSSLFVVAIYCLILQCELPTTVAHATIEFCLNHPSMPHPLHITSYCSPTTISITICVDQLNCCNRVGWCVILQWTLLVVLVLYIMFTSNFLMHNHYNKTRLLQLGFFNSYE